MFPPTGRAWENSTHAAHLQRRGVAADGDARGRARRGLGARLGVRARARRVSRRARRGGGRRRARRELGRRRVERHELELARALPRPFSHRFFVTPGVRCELAFLELN